VVRIGSIWLLILVIIQLVLFWRLNSGQIDPFLYEQMSRANGTLGLIWLIFMLVAMAGDWVLRRMFHAKAGAGWSKIFSIVMVFHFVTLCWIFFRSGAANTFSPTEVTYAMLGQIGSSFSLELASEVIAGYGGVMFLIALGLFLHFLPRSVDLAVEKLFIRLPAIGQAFILFLVIWVVIQTASADVVPFIYFQF
jgi:hypothetical protein